MDTNDIRNYNEITDNGIKPSIKYSEKLIPIKTEEDKDACLRFLTINNNSLSLCHTYYSVEYINSIMEYSDCLIYFSFAPKIDLERSGTCTFFPWFKLKSL